MTAAGVFEGIDAAAPINSTVGWAPTITATAVAFLVAYATIAWLLKFVAHHKITVFIWYRIAAGLVLAVALTAGLMNPT